MDQGVWLALSGGRVQGSLCDLGKETRRRRSVLLALASAARRWPNSGSARAREVFWSESEPGPDSGPSRNLKTCTPSTILEAIAFTKALARLVVRKKLN
jgi:hypothetical protein